MTSHPLLLWVGVARHPYRHDDLHRDAQARLRERAVERHQELTGPITVVVDEHELSDISAAVVVAYAAARPAPATRIRPTGPGLWDTQEVSPL